MLAWPTIVAAGQQAPTPPRTPASLRWQVRDTTRVESWRFFEPKTGGGNPDYTFIANRLFVGIDYRHPRIDAVAAAQYVQFGGLPTNATGPGALGSGPQYFDHAGDTNSRQLYLKALYLRLKSLAPGVTIQAGRFGYATGAESASGQASIEAVKRMRLDARLIGEFEWSIYQRAFDGVRIDVERSRWHATGSWFRPTQGGFEEQAGRPLRHVALTAGTFALRPSTWLRNTDWQAFVYRYDDERAVRGRPDNTGSTATAADVDVTSTGTSVVGVYPAARGEVDVLGWVVLQRGSWYGQQHRAGAVAAEIGYRPSVGVRPWVRAGWFRSTGDTDRNDATHGTFFQMLPTARRFALSTAYNLMNLTDTFAQVLVRPVPQLNLRLDVHQLRLTRASDLWYAGSGATVSEGAPFGYAGRTSNGSRALGTMVEGTADWTVTPHVAVNGYLGRMVGGSVVRGTFAGDTLVFAYMESVVTF